MTTPKPCWVLYGDSGNALAVIPGTDMRDCRPYMEASRYQQDPAVQASTVVPTYLVDDLLAALERQDMETIQELRNRLDHYAGRLVGFSKWADLAQYINSIGEPILPCDGSYGWGSKTPCKAWSIVALDRVCYIPLTALAKETGMAAQLTVQVWRDRELPGEVEQVTLPCKQFTDLIELLVWVRAQRDEPIPCDNTYAGKPSKAWYLKRSQVTCFIHVKDLMDGISKLPSPLRETAHQAVKTDAGWDRLLAWGGTEG